MPLKRWSTKNSESDLKEQDFDFNFKFLMLGNAGVGKSCFLVRYTQHSYTVETRATVATESSFKAVVRNDKKIKLHIMDTGKFFRQLLLSFFAQQRLPRKILNEYWLLSCLRSLHKIT